MKKPTKKARLRGQAAKPVVYDPAKIESKWQKKWASSKIFQSKEDPKKDKFYVLDMFPYPSGEGLHVGHPKGFIATDVISHMKRMQGKSVLHPMGFDAFGLPAENYAIKTKTNPEVAVKKNVARYKEQLEMLGLDYDWSREVNTTDPNYYRWTQWIFLQLYKKGLAFESNEPVNWCPTDKTVLANEDVEDGRCERCGTPVEKKPLRQWVLRITDYADRLLKDLDATDYVMPVLVDKVNPHRPGKPFVKRNVAHAIVYDPKTKKYLIIRNKKFGWDTVVIGGIEGDEDPIETARREVREETGYTDLEFKRILGGQTEAHYYTKHKDQNRIAYATAVYFELKSDARVAIGSDEDKDNEILWIDEADFVPGKMVNSELPIWLERLKDLTKGHEKPLLDWPNSIKELQRNWIGKSEGAEIDFRLTMTKNKTKFVILHGFEGSAKTNFVPWLKKELESRGHEVQAPELPNSMHPKESEQVDYVLKNVKFDENTVVIAHSLGSVVILKALMKLNKPIGGLVLVASAVDPKFDKHYDSRPFAKDFSWDYDFELIKKLTGGKIAVLSDLTEKFRAPYLKHLAGQLSARLVETTAKEEHFCATEEPEVLKAVTPSVTVFTTRPDTLFGVTYIVLAPEHPWMQVFLPHIENKSEVEAYIAKAAGETEIQRTDASKEKTGVELKGIKAVNPATGEEVPVWIADYVLADYGTGAVMAVPAHDDRDWDFATKYGLPIKYVVAPYIVEKKDPPKKELPMIYRPAANIYVRDPKNGKYLVLEWKTTSWKGPVTGGIEKGEDIIVTAKRELREETGYRNVRFVRHLGSPLRVDFYHPAKKENRAAEFHGVFMELVNDERDEVAAEETARHTPRWLTEDETKAFLNTGMLFFSRINQEKLPYTEAGRLINSGIFSDIDSESVKKKIVEFAGGRWVTKYKLRDWVFSRQRYWGEPIPLIHCQECGVVPVPEKDLPVKLPKVKSYEPTGTGESPLANISSWVNVKCPKCKGKARRETNTMPQWAGSCWYYLRYMDPKNKKAFVDAKKEKYWAPVDLYVGGAEHATRHLIYARFWHKVLFDLGYVSTIEPFIKLQSVGLIMGSDGRKMGKRFGNVVNPDDMVKMFGADSLRIYEMFMGPFDQQISWSTDSIVGTRRFIERVWKLKEKVMDKDADKGEVQVINKTIKKVTEDIENFRLNTAVSALMIAVNELEKQESVSQSSYELLLKLIAPFAPHVTEELWTNLGNKKSIHVSEWPKFDPKLAADSEVKIIVQISGKVRGSFMAPAGAANDELLKLAKELPEAKKWLEGKEVKKEIVVPGRLVNLVV